jgi:hypothetical protein
VAQRDARIAKGGAPAASKWEFQSFVDSAVGLFLGGILVNVLRMFPLFVSSALAPPAAADDEIEFSAVSVPPDETRVHLARKSDGAAPWIRGGDTFALW